MDNNKIAVSYRLDRKLYENFKDRCKAENRTCTQVLETLIFDYLQFPDEHKENVVKELREEFLEIARESNKILSQNTKIYLEKIEQLERDLIFREGEVQTLKSLLQDTDIMSNQLNAIPKKVTRIVPDRPYPK